MSANCPFCAGQGGGRLIAGNAELRIVEVAETEFADYPGYLRILWNAHVTEFSDLSADERGRLMTAIARVEARMREALAPDKVNLASLGNMVPHLHWHLIPRFRDDPHFPGPVWAPRRRDVEPDRLADRRRAAAALAASLAQDFPA